MKLNTRYVSNNYPIIVEHRAIDSLESYISNYQHVFILIDEYVSTLWPSIKDRFKSYIVIDIPEGEKVKYIQHYDQYMNEILQHHPTRHTCIVAIGGGATGDFAGFIAATLLRGVDFIQVPTTLLAHDSSVGGKVGINASYGKNLIGAFHRPKAVIYDLNFLTTLPTTEIQSGYAEIYKHALLTSPVAVDTLEKHYASLQHLKQLKHIEQHIIQGIKTKLDIVIEDEKEKGQRKFLNLGHTFGHAIEYAHHIPHGHAVMIGILYQYYVANIVLDTHFSTEQFYHYLKQLEYPLTLLDSFDFDTLYTFMLSDKKNDATGVQMVLLESIGHATVKHIPKPILNQAFEAMLHYHREVK